MSIGGSPIDTSLVQAAQAQQTASKTRDRERAETERTRRPTDEVELKVAGMESGVAVRRLPQNDSEQAGAERDAKGQRDPQEPEEGRGRVDVTA